MGCTTCGKARKNNAALGRRVASPDGNGVTASSLGAPTFGVRLGDETTEYGSYIEAFRVMRETGGQLVTIEHDG